MAVRSEPDPLATPSRVAIRARCKVPSRLQAQPISICRAFSIPDARRTAIPRPTRVENRRRRQIDRSARAVWRILTQCTDSDGSSALTRRPPASPPTVDASAPHCRELMRSKFFWPADLEGTSQPPTPSCHPESADPPAAVHALGTGCMSAFVSFWLGL